LNSSVLIITAAVLIGIAVFLYWTSFVNRDGSADKIRPSIPILTIVFLAFVLLIWLSYDEGPRYSYTLNDEPIAISIAFDLSPSMLAIPDPSILPNAETRFERGRAVLYELFGSLEDSEQNYIVSMIGFTEKAQVILGWESNISQVREILEFVISPELFTSTGTSIEAAINALANSFNTLPQNLRERSHKIGILVSDGEDTLPYSYLEYAIEKVETSSFDIVSLQTGLLGQNEGVPEYGEFGEFLHFQPMSGKLYTVPDVDTMMKFSEVESHRGLYVRAEAPNAVENILEFIGSNRFGDAGIDKNVAILLALFLIVTVIYARLMI
jgi:hypothetical protein